MRALIGAMAAVLTATVVSAAPGVAAAKADAAKHASRINEAATVLREIHAAPDKDIPQQLWDNAQCVIKSFRRLKKAAFVVGGERWQPGLMSCRHEGSWTAPIFMDIGKGSWGLQIGAQSIDLVLLVNNKSGMEKMLRDKVSLGVEASAAAGPVGRDARAATDAQMKAEILSYSRTQGLFAGVNLSGGVVKANHDDNADLYGETAPRDVVMLGSTKAPAVTEPFMLALQRQ